MAKTFPRIPNGRRATKRASTVVGAPVSPRQSGVTRGGVCERTLALINTATVLMGQAQPGSSGVGLF